MSQPRAQKPHAASCPLNPGLSSVRPLALLPLGSRPLVSILISCRNYERFVGECLDSVVRQTYTNLDVIVADDGSEDRSREVVAAIARADRRVRLVERPHGGMAASLNTAWQVSAGKIVCLLDADDTFDPQKVECVVEGFASHPRAGLLIHRAVRTNITGDRRGVLPLMGSLPSGWCLAESLVHGGILPNIPPTSNMAIRREIADRLFPLPEEFTGYAERIIQRLAPFVTEICSLDRALATWRLHGSNDANAARMDVDRIDRDIRMMERLWQIQRDYLEQHAPGLADSLSPLSQSDYYCRMRYLRDRLTGDRGADSYRLALLASPGFSERPALERVFWRVADRLPENVISTVGNWMITQGRIKELLSTLLEVESRTA